MDLTRAMLNIKLESLVWLLTASLKTNNVDVMMKTKHTNALNQDSTKPKVDWRFSVKLGLWNIGAVAKSSKQKSWNKDA